MSPPRWRAFGWAAVLVVAGCAAIALRRPDPDADRRAPPRPPLTAKAPTVWALDASERLASADGAHPAMRGSTSWQPGGAVQLQGLRDETVAFQLVVTAAGAPLENVTVEIQGLPDGITVDRFVAVELHMARRSAGRDPRESLGWKPGAQPPVRRDRLVDPLIPVALAGHPAAKQGTPWDYPMTVPPRHHRVVWVDLHLPRDLEATRHEGRVTVTQGATSLAELPLTVDVAAATLPYAAAKTMLYVEPGILADRIGDGALAATFQLLHRHHVTPVVMVDEPATLDAEPVRGLLTGDLFTPARGYQGPGTQRGTDLVVLGIYGTLGMPTPATVGNVERIVERIDALAPEADRFLYAVDETCDSPRGPAWRKALANHPRLSELTVGHTCSAPPATQDVDLVMMLAEHYRPALAAAAPDKRVWIYNGVLPFTGSFLTDGWPTSLVANPWIQWRHGIERWFYWESVFWNDGNRGGQGPYDPLTRAETFHNQDEDHCNGDGVLLYPGRQRAPGRLDLGAPTTLPSFRLKQWRRGIQDAGYLTLVAQTDPALARTTAAAVVGDNFTNPRKPTPTFAVEAARYAEARRKLFDHLARKAPLQPNPR